MIARDKIFRSFKEAVKVIDGQKRLLASAQADKDILEAYDAIVKYLYRLSPSRVEQLVGGQGRTNQDLKPEEIERAKALSLNEIEKMLNDESTSKKELEAVAVGRFDYPKGSLRSIGKAENLKQLIFSFVSNEKAHSSIKNLTGEK